jgi:phage repressor protein C with HTH and peptisase S24 domain
MSREIIIEIVGNSMEPIYQNGTKVKCEEVMTCNWPDLSCGVYVFDYVNFLLVRRVKRKPKNNVLKLHSDNPTPGSGGTDCIALQNVSKIWKALRIVDAPAL